MILFLNMIYIVSFLRNALTHCLCDILRPLPQKTASYFLLNETRNGLEQPFFPTYSPALEALLVTSQPFIVFYFFKFYLAMVIRAPQHILALTIHRLPTQNTNFLPEFSELLSIALVKYDSYFTG